MNLVQILDDFRQNPKIQSRLTAWRVLPAREGNYADLPGDLDPRLRKALTARGIHRLYSHQAEAYRRVQEGEHVIVVTPTASGKTLCYNLPVLQHTLQEESCRAIYLFPTKALSQDQVAELNHLIDLTGADIKTYTYDGDTPTDARKAIRAAGHIVVTNPDMLHTGILPHHTKWMKLFENLRFVVIDEIHQYRGVFGSHVANVIRRLKRICRFYGSNPQFLACSATIANPGELAAKLTGEKVRVVDNNGAPRGEKHFLFYNPPVVNHRLGIRRSCILESKDLAAIFLRQGIQTITFTRSRLMVEVLLTYLRKAVGALSRIPKTPSATVIYGYRGGYLPRERRRIEKGLRTGEITGVVSTNALELGIDIGSLQVAVLCGYPGTVSSTWQQAGRAGRRAGVSAAILVAGSSPLDQYVVTHPEYFFGGSPEHGLVNPDNLYILVSHLKCAAFELPFQEGEEFGVDATSEILEFLEEEGVLHRAGNRWYWMSESFPAEEISLRSASAENFVVIDTTNGSRVIGEVDRPSAPMLVHEEAIYIHGGQQYQVERLDYEEKKAYVRQVDVNYYTDANLAVQIAVLEVDESQETAGAVKNRGEVSVTAVATMFKKIKLYTHETIGSGRIHLPEEQMHTTAYWLTVPGSITTNWKPDDLQAALVGLATLLENIAPLYLMCDTRDIRAVPQVRSPFTGLPTVYIYDSYPGGIGLSEKVYSLHEQLLSAALEVLENCPCREGCPSCTQKEIEKPNKGLTKNLLLALCSQQNHQPASGPTQGNSAPEKTWRTTDECQG